MKQVTAAVIVEEGRLFLTRRGPAEALPGLWELPGGKVEVGETLQACLVRELMEELSMRASARTVLARTTYHYEHGSFEMFALETERQSDFELTVHDAFCWATQADVFRLPLAPADVELVDTLVRGGYLR